MRCGDCKVWVQQRVTTYDDGSTISNYLAPEGKGHCGALDLDTVPDFGCRSYEEGCATDHVIVAHKAGAPWQHHQAGPCPDCVKTPGASGDAACHRCAGTAQVRHYDDGYIGEEQTRLHPKERALRGLEQPTCVNCSRPVDVMWVACPYCGARTNKKANTEVIANRDSGLPFA